MLRQRDEELAARDAQVAAARLSFEESRNRYIGGLTPYVNVMTALNTVQSAELGLIQARRDRLTAHISLHNALGALGTGPGPPGRWRPPMTDSERSAEHPSEAIPPMPRPGRVKWLKAAATLGAACAGLVGAMGLYATGSAAEKTTPPERVDLVEATRIEAARAQARVEATGTVIADQQVVLSPEVAGRLTWVADGLKPGQRFSKGSTIARIDSRDYEAGVAAERSRLHQAELELSLEENRGTVAAREWDLIGGDASGDGSLALREPHLEVARANVEAAQASLDRAELNLSRTNIRAPFNAVVLSENVDVGQVIGSASQVAILAGTDRVRVEASVPYDRLSSLAIPGVDGVTADEASTATVRHTLGDGSAIVRSGRVVGMGGQLDPQTRTARPHHRRPVRPARWRSAPADRCLRGHHDRRPLRRRGRRSPTAVYDGDAIWVVGDDSSWSAGPWRPLGHRRRTAGPLGRAGDEVVTAAVGTHRGNPGVPARGGG